MSEEKKTSVCFHRLKVGKPTIAQALVTRCVMPPLAAQYPSKPAVWRVTRLQQARQRQYFRLTKLNPDKCFSYTYDLNCPPAGYRSYPRTQPCAEPKICPWCFVRLWLEPAVKALLAPPPQFRNLHRFIVWQRELPFATSKLPFFRRDRGPHDWFNAAVTVQLVVPFLREADNELQLRHVGIQMIPKTVDVAASLASHRVQPELQVTEFEAADREKLGSAFGQALVFPWTRLFYASNLDSFTAIGSCFPGKQMLRINRYKPKPQSEG